MMDLSLDQLPLAPHSGSVDIWIWQDHGIPFPDDCLLWLSDSEKAQIDHFKTGLRQREYLAGRIMIRSVLARYLDCQPGEVNLEIRPSGKPFVRQSKFDFNLSHSGSGYALAISRAGNVGVDIEWLNRKVDYFRLSSVFRSSEIEAWDAETPDLKRMHFFQRWTGKEAIFKACGDRALLFRDFEVKVPDMSPVVNFGEYPLPQNWWFQAFPYGDEYWVCLAVANPTAQIEFRTLEYNPPRS
ncbi:4'-phosphopantetheinyl transferase superfamily protein [Pontibacter sp. G13]|uniref:4'-phosphopantetheinyl transferase family protein n=1 Tax=Pontibacter sp. G13 TaxID=3074898 RepID=UPI00288C510A|nr:4'-phosphopantetheinyl transferase superfamily protein [Pontibacter sp. G13]WNJ21127.1 4'-phosphopantetheinyl transferase superfamily protein [Pontibacter sp. G13]